jgi:hypothetical protein
VYDANSKLDRIAARLARRRQRRVVQIIRELRQSSHPNILDTNVVVQPPPGGDGMSKVDACRVYNSANISIPNSTFTALTFDSELFDNNNLHSTTVNPSRITIQTAGVYVVSATVEWAATTTSASSRYITFKVNGTTTIAYTELQTTASLPPRHSLSTIYALNLGDYIEVFVRQDESVAILVMATAGYSPHFSAVMVGTLT